MQHEILSLRLCAAEYQLLKQQSSCYICCCLVEHVQGIDPDVIVARAPIMYMARCSQRLIRTKYHYSDMSGTLPPMQVNCAVNIRKAYAKMPM